MPAKAQRPAGQGRSHSRSSSGSKLGLNHLLFTQQKDLPPPRVSDKGKKSLIHHEPSARVASQFIRSNSGIRVHSREPQPPILRRAQPPSASQNGAKQSVDFTIVSSGDGEDDDEWVSSESGAATPNAESDAETTPIEQAKLVGHPVPLREPQSSQLNAAVGHDVTTPKAAPTSLPRVDTARPSELPHFPTPRNYAQTEQEARPDVSSSQTPADQRRPQLEIQISSPTPPVNKARSETHSPPRWSPDIDLLHKRQSMTRPPSAHSITSPVLRPHPLIRGLSSGPGAHATKPIPLTPLTTVLPDSASGEISNTSSSPKSIRASSPTSIRTLSANSPSSSSQAHKQLRRTSTSSVTSVATLPVEPYVNEYAKRFNHDRQRTMSTVSSNSSIAALLRSTPPPSHTSFTSHFPPKAQTSIPDSIHPLLPPPYHHAHLSVVRNRNPIYEAYHRLHSNFLQAA